MYFLLLTLQPFLRQLDVTVGQADFGATACVESFASTFAFSIGITNATACTPKAVLTTGTTANDLTFTCSAITETSATSISCGGAATGTPAAGTYKLKSVADTATSTPVTFGTVPDQTKSIKYAVKNALGTNSNQTVDYNDDAKKKFTITFTNNFVGTPEIKAGSTAIAGCTANEKVVTCAPTATEMPATETPYEIKYMNGCTETTTSVFVTVSSAFGLKFSGILAVLAMLIL